MEMSTMSDWVQVATLDQLPPGTRLIVDLAYETVALFNVDGVLYCIADVCTHDGGPLADGELLGCQIECPRHGAHFDIRTGEALSLPATSPAPTYAVRVEGNDIFVEEPDDDW
jgi:3-phenylpropionate/trans-cinnamate dioxygenase ferredoxin subunit